MVFPAFLIGLGFVLVATVWVVVRGVRLWHEAKRTGNVLASELASFDERAARAEELLAEWERSGADLELAVERLRISRARLQVLLDAIRRAEDRTRWLRTFIPV